MELKNNMSNYMQNNFLNLLQVICNAEDPGDDTMSTNQ